MDGPHGSNSMFLIILICNNISNFKLEKSKSSRRVINCLFVTHYAVDARMVRDVCSKYIYDKCPALAAVGK